MLKSKVSYQQKIEAVKNTNVEKVVPSIAREYNVHVSGLKNWVDIYESIGPSAWLSGNEINRYTAELKTTVVEAYLRGEGKSKRDMQKI
jgi:transposase